MEYYNENKEHILEDRKEFYKDNKDHILEERAKYYKDNYKTKITIQRGKKKHVNVYDSFSLFYEKT